MVLENQVAQAFFFSFFSKLLLKYQSFGVNIAPKIFIPFLHRLTDRLVVFVCLFAYFCVYLVRLFVCVCVFVCVCARACVFRQMG